MGEQLWVNGKNAYELKGKFLCDLYNNAFSRINEKDAVEHIEYYLKIIDEIRLPNVDHDKLRIVVFPMSLTGDPDLLTKDIIGFKTYEDYKDGWLYEWNENVPWVDEKPWTNAGVWTKPVPFKHTYKTFNYNMGCSEWPTSGWKDDGYCNEGNLPGAYHIGNSLHYQDLEWYEASEDSEPKDEALRNKAIMEGLINDDESSNDCRKNWKSHEIYYHNYDEGEYENETRNDGHELYGDEARRAYREIFQMMDKGWMVNLDNSTSNVLIPLDSWTSRLLLYKEPLSNNSYQSWSIEEVMADKGKNSSMETFVLNDEAD
uniref:Uncharacterized protein n=1 Tax=Tanacetum cinerariifolium TaxID=118510 RepID=A0A699GMY5_TANCI|nr:hypothetical protein [Tanacetum cinerariifolium]